METDGNGTRRTEAHRGFFPIVTGDAVSLRQAGARLCLVRGDLDLTQAGGMQMLAAGDLSIREGGGLVLMAGGDAEITEGGALVVAARDVRLDRAFVGLVIGRTTKLGDDVKVLLGGREAAIIGVAAGLVCALATRVFGRREAG